MPIEYQSLDTDEMREIVEARLRQLESEHYSLFLMRGSIEQAVDIDEQQKAMLLSDTDAKLTTLERSIALHREERGRLG